MYMYMHEKGKCVYMHCVCAHMIDARVMQVFLITALALDIPQHQ